MSKFVGVLSELFNLFKICLWPEAESNCRPLVFRQIIHRLSYLAKCGDDGIRTRASCGRSVNSDFTTPPSIQSIIKNINYVFSFFYRFKQCIKFVYITKNLIKIMSNNENL